MHFWSLHFQSFLNLVPKLILLKSENRFYFGPYRQSTNRKYIRDRQNTMFADVANKIIIIKYILHFLIATSHLN